jgi:hypothetical protein
MSHKKFSSSLELFALPKDFGLGTLRFDVLTPLGEFITTCFRMEIVSSAASNRSVYFSAREMYKLSVLSTLSTASFNRSMIEHSSPYSSCPIKISRHTKRS